MVPRPPSPLAASLSSAVLCCACLFGHSLLTSLHPLPSLSLLVLSLTSLFSSLSSLSTPFSAGLFSLVSRLSLVLFPLFSAPILSRSYGFPVLLGAETAPKILVFGLAVEGAWAVTAALAVVSVALSVAKGAFSAAKELAMVLAIAVMVVGGVRGRAGRQCAWAGAAFAIAAAVERRSLVASRYIQAVAVVLLSLGLNEPALY